MDADIDPEAFRLDLFDNLWRILYTAKLCESLFLLRYDPPLFWAS